MPSGPYRFPTFWPEDIDGAEVNRVRVRVRQRTRDDNALRGGSVVFQEVTVHGPKAVKRGTFGRVGVCLLD